LALRLVAREKEEKNHSPPLEVWEEGQKKNFFLIWFEEGEKKKGLFRRARVRCKRDERKRIPSSPPEVKKGEGGFSSSAFLTALWAGKEEAVFPLPRLSTSGGGEKKKEARDPRRDRGSLERGEKRRRKKGKLLCTR